MATQTLNYGRDGRWSFRQLPWRRIGALLLVGYVMLYLVMRGTGVITYSWGVGPAKVDGPAYAGHIWEFKSDSDVLRWAFAPLVLLEQGVRDLGGHKSS